MTPIWLSLRRREAEQRKKREVYLKSLVADFEHSWKMLHPLAERATAAAYDEVWRVIADLAEACALTARKKDFGCALRGVYGASRQAWGAL